MSQRKGVGRPIQSYNSSLGFPFPSRSLLACPSNASIIVAATLSETAALTAEYNGFANSNRMLKLTSVPPFTTPAVPPTPPPPPPLVAPLGRNVHLVASLLKTAPPLLSLPKTPSPLRASTSSSGRQRTLLAKSSSKPPQPTRKVACAGQRVPWGSGGVQWVTAEAVQ